MSIKKYKPTSPARRFMTVSGFDEITSSSPERSLLVSLNKTGGRNSMGRITVRHIGGGNRNKYRIIDFKRNKDNIPAKVQSVQYDPNRSANIALLVYADGEKRYILAPLVCPSATPLSAATQWTSRSATRFPFLPFPSALWCTTSRWNPARADKSRERQAALRS